MTSRRAFLAALGASAAAVTFGGVRRALAGSNANRRFLFVYAAGGWDPLTVFAPSFDSDVIEMDPEAEPWSIGGFNLVDGPGRPAVRSFFEQHHDRCTLFNGINVRSLSHEVCSRIVLAGSSELDAADWPTRIAAGSAGDFPIPHLDYSGFLLAGDHASVAARVGYGGQLDGLLTGDFIDSLDAAPRRLSPSAESLTDAFVQRRAEAYGASPPRDAGPFARDLADSQARAARLRDATQGAPIGSGLTFREQADAAVSSLARGLCRTAMVVTVESPWDTHDDNALQAPLFDGLFADLTRLQQQLATTASPSGGTLADDTVVVVLSEMGRTPRFNEGGGRDHWPFTSALVIGGGVAEGRTIGAFDDRYAGRGVDPASGDIDASRPALSAADLGATLLLGAGVDPGDALAGTSPIEGVFS